MSLEHCIKQIEDKFPEMKGRLKKYCGGYDQSYWEGEVKYAEYIETKKSQMVIAHWQEYSREFGEPDRSFAWITLYRKDKKGPFSYVKKTHIMPRKEIVY
jgi:hypothetical protein